MVVPKRWEAGSSAPLCCAGQKERPRRPVERYVCLSCLGRSARSQAEHSFAALVQNSAGKSNAQQVYLAWCFQRTAEHYNAAKLATGTDRWVSRGAAWKCAAAAAPQGFQTHRSQDVADLTQGRVLPGICCDLRTRQSREIGRPLAKALRTVVLAHQWEHPHQHRTGRCPIDLRHSYRGCDEFKHASAPPPRPLFDHCYHLERMDKDAGRTGAAGSGGLASSPFPPFPPGPRGGSPSRGPSRPPARRPSSYGRSR
eukprot:SAG31_NODE_498_length_14861_cov_3.405026_7_plen_255_part_00